MSSNLSNLDDKNEGDNLTNIQIKTENKQLNKVKH